MKKKEKEKALCHLFFYFIWATSKRQHEKSNDHSPPPRRLRVRILRDHHASKGHVGPRASGSHLLRIRRLPDIYGRLLHALHPPLGFLQGQALLLTAVHAKSIIPPVLAGFLVYSNLE